jgi:hypothetical protein
MPQEPNSLMSWLTASSARPYVTALVPVTTTRLNGHNRLCGARTPPTLACHRSASALGSAALKRQWPGGIGSATTRFSVASLPAGLSQRIKSPLLCYRISAFRVSLCRFVRDFAGSAAGLCRGVTRVSRHTSTHRAPTVPSARSSSSTGHDARPVSEIPQELVEAVFRPGPQYRPLCVAEQRPRRAAWRSEP